MVGNNRNGNTRNSATRVVRGRLGIEEMVIEASRVHREPEQGIVDGSRGAGGLSWPAVRATGIPDEGPFRDATEPRGEAGAGVEADTVHAVVGSSRCADDPVQTGESRGTTRIADKGPPRFWNAVFSPVLGLKRIAVRAPLTSRAAQVAKPGPLFAQLGSPTKVPPSSWKPVVKPVCGAKRTATNALAGSSLRR